MSDINKDPQIQPAEQLAKEFTASNQAFKQKMLRRSSFHVSTTSHDIERSQTYIPSQTQTPSLIQGTLPQYAPNSFPKAIVYPKKSNSQINQVLPYYFTLQFAIITINFQIPNRRSSLNVFKAPAPANTVRLVTKAGPTATLNKGPEQKQDNQKYVKLTFESNKKFEVVQSKPKYVVKTQHPQKPSTSTGFQKLVKLPSADKKTVKYVISQNLTAKSRAPIQNAKLVIMPNLSHKPSFRPYYVPEKKKQTNVTEDLFEIFDDSAKKDAKQDETSSKELEEIRYVNSFISSINFKSTHILLFIVKAQHQLLEIVAVNLH